MIKLSELLEEYELELNLRKVSYSTRNNYIRYLRRFITFIGDKDIEDVSNKEARHFIKHLQAEGFKSKTVNLAATAIRGMFTYAEEEDYLDANPIKIKKVKETDVKEIHLFTESELIRLMQYNKRSRLYTKFRDHCIILTFIDTGIRANELINIELDDVADDYIRIEVTKNSKPRLAPMSNTLKKALIKLSRLRTAYFDSIDKNPSDYLYVSRTGKKLHRANVNDIIIKACRACDISREKAYPHLLRHSFACYTMKNTQNIYLTSKLLGHSSTNITELYLRGIQGDDIVEMAKSFVSENLRD